MKLGQNMTSLLPSFVYIMYFLTVADKACRAMFYNCDKDSIPYSFYPQAGYHTEEFPGAADVCIPL